MVKTCLAYEPNGIDLKQRMRSGASDDELEAALRAAVLRKPFSHICNEDGTNPFEGKMIQIGG